MTNVFDLVPSPKPQKEPEEPKAVHRVCSYRDYYNRQCKNDAVPEGFTCPLHGGSKSSLIYLRRELINLGPAAVERIQELMEDDDSLVRLGAVKLFFEQVGFKELTKQATGFGDQEELDTARRSLSGKLDSMLRQLGKRQREKIA